MNNYNKLNQQNKHKTGCLKSCMIVIGVLFCISIIDMKFFRDGGVEHLQNPCDDTNKIYAYNCAARFVKKELKSPFSAVFPDTRQKVHDTECNYDNTYKIDSYVESQNSFGAIIKTNFSCTIRFDGESVYCEDLIFY